MGTGIEVGLVVGMGVFVVLTDWGIDGVGDAFGVIVEEGFLDGVGDFETSPVSFLFSIGVEVNSWMSSGPLCPFFNSWERL